MYFVVPTTIAVGSYVHASWSCTLASSANDWVALMQGSSVYWYKIYSAGVKSDTLDTSTGQSAWKVPSTTGVIYKFVYVHNNVVTATSSYMTSA